MKKTAIKIKTYTTKVNIVNNNDLSSRVLNSLLIGFGILVFGYILILGNTVFNIVERQSLISQSKTLSNEVGDLELKYLAMSNKIDATLSKEMGFKETKIQFATRKSLTALKFTSNEF